MRRTALRLGLGALAVLVVGSGLLELFTGPVLLVGVVVASVAPAVVAWWGHSRRWPLSASLLASAAALAIAVCLFATGADALIGAPSLGSIGEALGGPARGWTDLLSANPPLPAEPSIVAFLIALVWAAGAASAELTLRARQPLLPGLAAIGLFLLVQVLNAGMADGLLRAAFFSAVLLAGMLVRAGQPSGEAAGGGAVPDEGGGPGPAPIPVANAAAAQGRATGLALIVAVVALAAIVTPHLPVRGNAPYELRDGWEVDVEQAQAIHPLALLQAELTREPRDLFTVATVSGGSPESLAASGQVRLVAFEAYDGVTWSAPGLLQRVGTDLPASGTYDGDLDSATLRVDIDALEGPWLPTVGRARQLRLDGREDEGRYDPSSGNLALAAADVPGTAYNVNTQLAAAPVPADADVGVDGYEELLQLPTGGRELVAGLVAGVARGRPVQMATDLARAVRDGYLVDPALAEPGHSIGNMGRFAAQQALGSAEHFATLFALAARELGLPSRLVVGYRIALGPSSAGPVTVRSSDMHAWPEVHLAGYGWVAFEPTPQDRKDALPDRDKVPQTTTVPPPEDKSSTALDQPAEEPSPPPPPPPPDQTWPTELIVILVVLAVVSLYLAALASWRLGRRARRRKGPPDARILGAWAQAREVLARDGVVVGGATTPAELARDRDEEEGSVGAGPLAELAPLVSLAVYGPDGASDAQASEAWAATDALAEQVRRSQSIRRRLGTAVLPWRPRSATPPAHPSGAPPPVDPAENPELEPVGVPGGRT